jgi:hypothetical protein
LPDCSGWQNCYAGFLRGGIQDDRAVDVVSDADGNLYVLGTTNGEFPGIEGFSLPTIGGDDMVLMKVTPQLSVEWVKLLGTTKQTKLSPGIDKQSGNLLVR